MLKEVIVRLFVVFALIAAVSFSTGCQKAPAAVVNGAKISEGVLNWHVNQRVKQHSAQGAVVAKSAIRKKVLDQLIDSELMRKAAADKGISVSEEEVKAEVRRMEESMGKEAFEESLRGSGLSRGELGRMVKGNMMAERFASTLVKNVTDKEIKEFYQTNPTPFLVPESVNVRFIQAETEEQAGKLAAELKRGADFDKLADRLQGENSAPVSAYSWMALDFFSPQMAKALRDAREGAYGGPVKGTHGYFVLRVKERRHARAKTVEEASDEIRALLFDQRRQEARAHWLAKNKEKADIKIQY